MKASNCLICPYYKLHKDNFFPLDKEDNGSDILIVLQSPGVQEWQNKKPLSSNSPISTNGKISSSWSRTGHNRQNFDITNVVQCYPGKNNITGRDTAPDQRAIDECSKNLEQDIISKEYNTIITFGKIAEKAVKKILSGTGRAIKLICAKHPAAAITRQELDGIWECVEKKDNNSLLNNLDKDTLKD